METSPSERGSSASRRTLWGFGDQLVSSGTNFALTIIAARNLLPRQFGIFAILTATFILTNGVVRGLVAEPLLVRYSHGESARWRPAVARALRGAVGLGAAVGLALALVAVAVPVMPNRGAVITLGLLLPGLLLQDTARYGLLAAGQPQRAFVSDVVWAALQFSALAVISVVHGHLDLEALIATWAGAGTVAGLVTVAVMRLPMPRQGDSWLREHGAMGTRFAADFLISQGSGQVTIFVLGALASAAQAGTFRVAQAVFGPLVVLFVGARLAILPELVRIRARDPEKLRRAVASLCLGLTVVPIIVGLIAYQLPTRVGSALFGLSWADARSLIPAMAIAVAAGGAETGAVSGIRALADAQGGLRARTIVGLVTLVASVIGAWQGGAQGAVIALAVVGPPGFIIWWSQFRRSYRDAVNEDRRVALS